MSTLFLFICFMCREHLIYLSRSFVKTEKTVKENSTPSDPLNLFDRWYGEARQASYPLCDAVALATATKKAVPSVRIVYFKGIKKTGFSFYTNYRSQKAVELAQNPWASMVFYWPDLNKQIRVSGQCVKMSKSDSKVYFQSRERESQLSAIASDQSHETPDFEALETKAEQLRRKYEGKTIPCPAFWGGFILKPVSIEFWLGKPHRRHHRWLYERVGRTWKVKKLFP